MAVDVTVTSALADPAALALLVAMTWNWPEVDGAVYLPVSVIVPPLGPSCTDQATAVLLSPVTLAVNWVAAPTPTVALPGLMLTETLGGWSSD
jgi:hypothetical protein